MFGITTVIRHKSNTEASTSNITLFAKARQIKCHIVIGPKPCTCPTINQPSHQCYKARELYTDPVVSQLKRHLYVSIGTNVATLDEPLSILIVDQEVKVDIAVKVAGNGKTCLDHILALKSNRKT